MAKSIRETFRQYLPGSGRTTTGAPVQSKTKVTGQISVTSYTAGGETLTPNQLGLSVIDWIDIRVANAVGAPAASSTRRAAYNQVDDLFYLWTVGQTGQTDEYASGATETLEYVAEGDSAYDVQLTS